MSSMEIGEGSPPGPPDDKVGYLCWRTREILGAYMLVAIPIEVPGEAKTTDLDAAPKESDSDDDWVEESDGPILHETHAVLINENRRVNLSNSPLLLSKDGELRRYTLPGYVALHIEPADLELTSYTFDPEVCGQLIFRLPHYGAQDEAAIFEGFNLDEDSRLDTLQENIDELDKFIEILRFAFFEMMTQGEGYYDGTYLSQTPEESIDAQLSTLNDTTEL